MAVKVLKDLIGDWGGFEKLVAKLHETGEVTVEHNVQLTGKSGATRQIDVVIRQKQGYYEHLIIVECKYWNKPVERLHVDAFASAVDDLNASKGVLFSTEGFQEGALIAGKHYGIDLYKVRELTDEEWGLPGKIIDFYMQFIQPSADNFQFQDIMFDGVPKCELGIRLRLGNDNNNSSTLLETACGEHSTLEEALDASIKKAAKQMRGPSSVILNGQDGTRYLRSVVTFAPPSPLRVSATGGTIIIPKVTFDLGLKILQSRMKIDRGENYNFILGVEDCIKGGVISAYRENADLLTKLTGIHVSEEAAKDALQNGSIMEISLKGFFPFSEVEGLKPGECQDVDAENSFVTL